MSTIQPSAADAASPEDSSRTITSTIERCGRLDVLVNNAGAGAILPLEAGTPAAIKEIFTANAFGPSLLATASAATEGISWQYRECLQYLRA
ncbi:MAG: SDR family NAD(P)-dependent oxidoreductase [Candidatus Sulfotelmatobacter sp.]